MPSSVVDPAKTCSKAASIPTQGILRCLCGGRGNSSGLFTDAKLESELDGNTRVSMQPPKTRMQLGTATAWEWSTGNPWRFRDGLPLALKIWEPGI
jgi:hypothetical protein